MRRTQSVLGTEGSDLVRRCWCGRTTHAAVAGHLFYRAFRGAGKRRSQALQRDALLATLQRFSSAGDMLAHMLAAGYPLPPTEPAGALRWLQEVDVWKASASADSTLLEAGLKFGVNAGAASKDDGAPIAAAVLRVVVRTIACTPACALAADDAQHDSSWRAPTRAHLCWV